MEQESSLVSIRAGYSYEAPWSISVPAGTLASSARHMPRLRVLRLGGHFALRSPIRSDPACVRLRCTMPAHACAGYDAPILVCGFPLWARSPDRGHTPYVVIRMDAHTGPPFIGESRTFLVLITFLHDASSHDARRSTAKLLLSAIERVI